MFYVKADSCHLGSHKHTVEITKFDVYSYTVACSVIFKLRLFFMLKSEI